MPARRDKGMILIAIGIVAIISIFLILSGAIIWDVPGTLIADEIVAVGCGSDYVDVTIKEYGKQTGYAEGDFCFYRDSSVILSHEGCGSLWGTVKSGYPEMTSARWGGHDISQFFSSPDVIDVLGSIRVCSHYAGNDGDISTYLYEQYGERFSSGNKKDIEFTFRFKEAAIPPADPCEGVVCQPCVAACPDGYHAWCDTYCQQGTGECTSCIPDCTGHEASEESTEEPSEGAGQAEKEQEINGLIILVLLGFLIGGGIAFLIWKLS